MVSMRDTKPHLQFRSERHAECLPCIGSIRTSHKTIQTSEQRGAYAKKLAECESSYEEHMNEVADYEQKMQKPVSGSASRKRKCKKGEEDLPELHDEKPTQLNMAQETGLEARQLLGILWPTKIYKDVTKKVPTEDQLTKMVIGTYEVTDFKKAVGSQLIQAASSEDAIGNEMAETWTHMKDLLKVNTTTVEKDGESTMVLEAGTKRKLAADDFDDLLDFAPDVSHGTEGPAFTRSRGGQGQGQGDSARAGPISKQMREIQTSQRVLLECRQAMDNLKSEQTLDLVKPKHITQLVDRLKSRLTPACCSLYAAGFDPASGEQTEGMKCLEDLRESQSLLTSAMVTGLSDNKVSGEELWKSACSCAEAYKPPSRVAEIAVQRAVDAAASEKQYESMMTLLTPTDASDSDNQGAFNINILTDAAARARFQEREVMRLCCSLLAEADKVADVEKLLRVVLAQSSCLPADCAIKAEFVMLQKLLNPMKEDVALDDLRKTASQFREEKSLKLHKVVTCFPTGLLILERVGAAILQREKDLQMQTLLDKVLNLLPSYTPPNGDTRIEKLAEQLAGLEEIWGIYQQVGFDLHIFLCVVGSVSTCRVNEGASKEFKERSSTHMDSIQKVIQDSLEAARQVMTTSWKQAAASCFELFVNHVSELTAGTCTTFDSEKLADFRKAVEKLTSIEEPDTLFGKITAKEDREADQAQYREILNLAKIIELTVQTLLNDGVIDVAQDENMGALTSVLVKPSAVIKALPQYDAFSQAATERSMNIISKACKTSLRPLLQTTEAKTLLAMMAHKGPGLVFVEGSALAEVDKTLLQTADKQCESLAKAIPACGVALATPVVGADGEPGDDPSGLSDASVRLWMACCFPRALALAHACQACLSMQLQVQSNASEKEKYEEFMKSLLAMDGERAEFKSRSHIAAFEIEGEESRRPAASRSCSSRSSRRLWTAKRRWLALPSPSGSQRRPPPCWRS
ncbi:unnamed protein product [Symbiodinium sp. CCMP2592]|nr:unnamed protein product [Symbiodinium sp. CCMP2592]